MMTSTASASLPAHWAALATRELDGAPLDTLFCPTLEGITLKPLYTSADVGPEATAAGLPPFTRGVRATMYANKPWTVRQYAGFSTVEESNAFYRNALAAGQMGLSVAFDLPTHRGYDSDHPAALADVGKAGVAVSSVEDMKALFAGIDLGKVSVSMTMNGAVLPIMAAYIVAAEEAGITPERLSGTLQNDILKEFLVRNTYIYPPAPSLRIVGDIIGYCAHHLPRFNPISISGYHMQEAGADAVSELAFTLADGLAYVDAARAQGLDVAHFAPRLSFFFGIGMNFFMEIAKLRAARTLWAEQLAARYNVTDPKALMLRTHCQTSGVSLTEQDPLNNIIRTAYEAMAAVLGGTQSLHTNAYDEALALPSDEAARLARNTQLILAEETGITRVVDPLGGSYYIEALTAELVDKARTLIAKVTAQGGMTQALQDGWVQAQIQETALKRQAQVDSGEVAIVGVNRYVAEGLEPVPVREIDTDAVRTAQLNKLKALKAARDTNAVNAALHAVELAAKNGGNLLEAVIPAMRARATVGEVSAVLERVFTRHTATPRQIKQAYGLYRQQDPRFTAAHAAVVKAGAPKLYIAKMGQDGHDRGAKVVAGAFSDLGFEVVLGPLFETPEQAVHNTLAANARIVGISSLAGAHKELVAQFMNALSKAGRTDLIVVVGGVIPPQDYNALFDLGIAAIYGPGTELTSAALELVGLLEGRNEPPRSRKP